MLRVKRSFSLNRILVQNRVVRVMELMVRLYLSQSNFMKWVEHHCTSAIPDLLEGALQTDLIVIKLSVLKSGLDLTLNWWLDNRSTKTAKGSLPQKRGDRRVSVGLVENSDGIALFWGRWSLVNGYLQCVFFNFFEQHSKLGILFVKSDTVKSFQALI